MMIECASVRIPYCVLRGLLFVLIVQMTSGCVYTSFGHEYDISYSSDAGEFDSSFMPLIYKYDGDNKSDVYVHMYMDCSDGDKFFTWMVSPIIPLPPVLPGYTKYHSPYVDLRLSARGWSRQGFECENAKLIISRDGSSSEIIPLYSDIFNGTVTWRLPDNYKCVEFDKTTFQFLNIKYDGEELDLPKIYISVEDKGLSFNVEYVTQ